MADADPHSVRSREANLVRLPVHGDVVARLRDLIVAGEFAEDEHLSERMLCERLQVSRSPMREALKAIAAEGLIVFQPNKGARVAKISVEELRDTFKVVEVLEIYAAVEACRRASEVRIAEIGELHFRMLKFHAMRDHSGYFNLNMQVHEKIVEAADNPVLLALYRQANARIRRFRYFSHQRLHAETGGIRLDEQSFNSSIQDHEKIFQALRMRDEEGIRALIHEHYSSLEPSLQMLVEARMHNAVSVSRKSEEEVEKHKDEHKRG